jgi:hypothetical protein
MATAALLDQIYHLPVSERMLIVERTIRSIRRDGKELMAFAEREAVQTHFASEQILAKDWSNKTEDEAWMSL